MIDCNHPAVEAALDAEDRTDGPMCRDTAHYMLEHALDHLTADDLRDTPAGLDLMAQAWEVGKVAGATDYASAHLPNHQCPTNPYLKETPNE